MQVSSLVARFFIYIFFLFFEGQHKKKKRFQGKGTLFSENREIFYSSSSSEWVYSRLRCVYSKKIQEGQK